MKYLGIDFGTKKVGLALSDESGSMGFPKSVVPNDPKLMSTVRELIAKEQVGGVVIGESRKYDGTDNAVAAQAKGFGARLQEESGLPVFFEPETLTTQEARRDFEGVRTSGKTEVDASAAALILTSYLSRTHGND